MIRLQPKRAGVSNQIQMITLAVQGNDIPDMHTAVELTVDHKAIYIQCIADCAIRHS